MGGKFSKGKPDDDSSSSSSSSSSPQQGLSSSPSSLGAGPKVRNPGSTASLHTMDPGSARIAASTLSLKEMSRLTRTSKANRQIFQPLLEEAKAVLPLLRAVVQGDVEKLMDLLLANSDLLLKKGQVTDPNGTTFYQVSPYLLMKFLADADMLNHMKPFLEPYGKVRRKQDAEMDSGGADLVKMDRDPSSIPFEEVLRFRTSYVYPPNPATEIEFPLLENEDGIIVYNNHFYYANKNEQTVVHINPVVRSKTEFKALEQLKASFSYLENSSRRSSNDEHALITNTMQRTLKRKGIVYERNAHGADLVKMNKDPQSLKFKKIAHLLENPDGILFYKDNFYYANNETKKVKLISPMLSSNPEQAKLDKEALDKLNASFVNMKITDTRRSDNAEHALIERTMGHALLRHTVRYCDSRADFNRLLNAYRTCDKLYLEEKWGEGDQHWRQEVGGAQRDVMWLLQRYCEKNRPFYPFPDFNASPFKRSFTIYNNVSGQHAMVFVNGHLHEGLGSDFGIIKRYLPYANGTGRPDHHIILFDLVTATLLVKDAKASVVEFSADQDLGNSNANLARGPG